MIWICLPLAAVVAGWYYRKSVPALAPKQRWLLTGLRFITVFIVLALLLNPIITWVRHQVFKPEILVLEDVSGSMDEKVSGQKKSDVLHSAATEIEKQLDAKGYTLKHVPFADGLDRTTRTTTLLQKALGELTQQDRLDHANAVLLLSDGWFKDDDLSALDAAEIPIYAVAPALTTPSFDLELTRISTNRTAYKGEQTPVAVDVTATGYRGRAKVELSEDGKALGTQSADFSKEPFVQVMFEPSFTTIGLHRLEAKITPDDGKTSATDEPDTGNNRFPTAIQVLADKTGILILTDTPNWDVRFLKDALQQNPKHAVRVLRYEQGIFYDGRRAVSPDEAITPQTTMVACVNAGNLNLPPTWSDRIKNLVNNGGGLLGIGQPVNGLSGVFPATRSNLTRSFEGTLAFTSTADTYETFRFTDAEVANIPPVDYFYVNPTIQAQVLARAANAQQSPVILMQPYGQGKCVYLACFGLWHWQLQQGTDYDKLIDDLSAWLSTGSGTRFVATTDRNGYLLGEAVTVRLSAFDERMNPVPDLNAEISVTDKAGHEVFHDFLAHDGDQYKVKFDLQSAGDYRFHITDKRSGQKTDGEFAVSDLAAESRDRGMNLPLLTLVTNATGGQLITGKDAPALPAVKPQRQDRRVEFPIYRKWWVIALFLLSFCLEIFFRKRWGLA